MMNTKIPGQVIPSDFEILNKIYNVKNIDDEDTKLKIKKKDKKFTKEILKSKRY